MALPGMLRVKRYYTYMLRYNDGSYYVGVTSNLTTRIAQHESGHDPSSYTYMRRPVRLVWSQECGNVDDAIRCEKQIQGWSRAKKQALIDGDFAEIQRLSKSHALTSST